VRANDTEVRTGERIVVATWLNIFSIHFRRRCHCCGASRRGRMV